MSVYLAFDPPGGVLQNPGACTVDVTGATAAENAAQVYNWTRIALGSTAADLLPRDRITIDAGVAFQCLSPSAVDGLNWTVTAIVDVHGDDAAGCDSLISLVSTCLATVADDDDDDANNSLSRDLPRVSAR